MEDHLRVEAFTQGQRWSPREVKFLAKIGQFNNTLHTNWWFRGVEIRLRDHFCSGSLYIECPGQNSINFQEDFSCIKNLSSYNINDDDLQLRTLEPEEYFARCLINPSVGQSQKRRKSLQELADLLTLKLSYFNKTKLN